MKALFTNIINATRLNVTQGSGGTKSPRPSHRLPGALCPLFARDRGDTEGTEAALLPGSQPVRGAEASVPLGERGGLRGARQRESRPRLTPAHPSAFKSRGFISSTRGWSGLDPRYLRHTGGRMRRNTPTSAVSHTTPKCGPFEPEDTKKAEV